MNQIKHRKKSVRRTLSVRSKLFGTTSRPRLSVHRTNKHISAQLIDDQKGEVILGAADQSKEHKIKGTKSQRAKEVALLLAQKMKKAKVKMIVFDRGSYRYHGRVKILAETLREEGINF